MRAPSPFLASLDRLVAALWRPRPGWQAYGLGLLLALAFVAAIFPLDFLAGRGAFFEHVDASQHVAGWLFFAGDSWHFPLLQTTRLNGPGGVNIAFMDSIPLAALLLKPFAALLPAGFHYLGWWHAVAFVTAPLAGIFLLRALGLTHLLAALCAAVFVLSWPALLWRVGHTSLLTHALLLAALGCYFLGRRTPRLSEAAARWLVAVACAALLVHPYLLAMTFAVLLAYLLDCGLGGEGWLVQARRLLLALVALVVLMFVGGYVGQGGGATATAGFGLHSMNLLAPWCGGALFDCAASTPARYFPAIHLVDANGGQYEGFNYLGLGLFLLLPFALAVSWRALPGVLRRHAGLVLLALCCLLYALSNKVYAGSQLLLEVPLPAFLDKLTGTFRASGRFFWLTGYLLLAATLAALLARPSHRVLLLFAVALPLQWADTVQLRAQLHHVATYPYHDEVGQWRQAMQGVTQMRIAPAYGCAALDPDIYGFFSLLAARYGATTDTGYVARANPDCAAKAAALQDALAPDTLLVVPLAYLEQGFEPAPRALRLASAAGACVRWQAVALCRKDADWSRSGLQTQPYALPTARRVEWQAATLPSVIGEARDGRMVSRAGAPAGVLSFGPYVTLPAGRYHYALRYASPLPPSAAAGEWDIASGADKEFRIHASGKLPGTGGADASVEGEFVAEGTLPLAQLRTTVPAASGLALLSISLARIEE